MLVTFGKYREILNWLNPLINGTHASFTVVLSDISELDILLYTRFITDHYRDSGVKLEFEME